MANLTLSIDDDLLKQARRIALDRDTSVNQLVREFLEQIVQGKSRKEKARQFLLTTRFPYDPTPLDRDSIYER